MPLEATLEWTGTADDFDVEVATDPEFLTVVFSTNTATNTIVLPPGTLLYETDYYWRVRGNNAFGAGGFSSTFVFTTVAPPDTIPPSPQNLSSPAQTGSTIDLLWDASTDNVGVVQYNVNRNGSPVASVGGTGFTDIDLDLATENDYQVSAVDAAGNESLRSEVLTVMTQSVSGPVTISVQVSAREDDAEERLSSGSVSLGSSDLELTQDRSRIQAVGFRFQSVAVPKGATIKKAFIQFTVDERNSVATSLEIRGQAADSPEVFTRSSGNITSRPTTAQAVHWTPPAWNTVGVSGPDQRTPDLRGVVQEIVDRAGWVEGRAIVFVITGSGERTAEAFDGVATAAPILTITYRIQ